MVLGHNLFSTSVYSATLSVESKSAYAGSSLTVNVSLSLGSNESVSALQFDVLYEIKACDVTGITAGNAVISAQKQLQYNKIAPGNIRVIIAGLNQNIIPSGSVAELSLQACASAPAGDVLLSLSNVILSSPTGTSVPTTTGSGTLTIQRTSYHSADQNHDWKISLAELLRVIQLYNSNYFYCSCTEEDGYGVNVGNRDCATHSSDYYGTPNWRIQLYELLRLIQIYNFGGYYPASGTEDGFALGSL